MRQGLKYQHLQKEWKELYDAGKSIRQIAIQYGIDAKTVNRTLTPVIEKRPKSKWAPFADRWYQLYTVEHWTKSDIARKYDVHPTIVGKMLEHKGIIPQESNRKRLYEEFIPDFIRLYQEGWSLAAISEKYHIDRQTISNYLEREGVPRRALSEAIRIHEIEEHYFDQIVHKEIAYHLGLLYAHGSLLEQHNGFAVQLSFSEVHYPKLMPFLKVLFQNGEIPFYTGNDGVYRIRLHSPHLYQTLLDLGFGSKLKAKTPPLSDSLLRSFFEGYLDSRLFVNTKEEVVVSGSRSILDSLRTLLERHALIPFTEWRVSGGNIILQKKERIDQFFAWLYEQ